MTNQNTQIAVIGHGSWATAIVKILTDANQAVNWFVRNPHVKHHIEIYHTNPKYLSSVHFNNPNLKIYDDINLAIEISQIVILATPSAFLKIVLENLTAPLINKFIISAIKGIVPDQFITIAEYLNLTHNISFDNIGVITGPCHAEEVASERLSYLTMACKNETTAKNLAKAFSTPYIRVNTSTDIYGTEYGAILKNIYAIAVGICHSLGYGDNFMAVLISNAANEMKQFMEKTYPAKRDILESAYLGDLLVTCYSQFSRNRTFGLMIGKGYSVKSAQMEMNMVAEGYYATECVRQVKNRCKVQVNMPIADAMFAILYERKTPATQIRKILPELK